MADYSRDSDYPRAKPTADEYGVGERYMDHAGAGHWRGETVTPTEPVLAEIKPDPTESDVPPEDLPIFSKGFFTGREDVENRNGTVIVPLDDQDVDLTRGYVRVAAIWYRLTDESALTDETVGLLLDEGIFTTYE